MPFLMILALHLFHLPQTTGTSCTPLQSTLLCWWSCGNASIWRERDIRINFHFSLRIHTRDVKVGTYMAALPGSLVT